MTITTQYKTEAGTTWASEQEAMCAEAIEKSVIYIESYKLTQLVDAVTRNFLLIPTVEVEQLKEQGDKFELKRQQIKDEGDYDKCPSYDEEPF